MGQLLVLLAELLKLVLGWAELVLPRHALVAGRSCLKLVLEWMVWVGLLFEAWLAKLLAGCCC